MQFVKQWTLCVCTTLMVAVILSLFAPKGNLGRFYKIIISIFIFISFLYPFTDISLVDIKPDLHTDAFAAEGSVDDTCSGLIAADIKSFLTDSDVVGADVTCVASYDNDVIEIKSVQIAVGDEYDVDEIARMVREKYGINARVIHIGQ